MLSPRRLSTPLIGVIAFVLLSIPAAAQPATPASFDSKGVRIQYVDRGGGVPVLLLHGFTGSYARHWEAPGVIDALVTAGYRVIAMDCRGHGQSGKPTDPAAYGLVMVDDAVRLLDYLHIDRAHVVGYSMGGAIANQLLVRHPARVRSVTLLGAGWEGDDLRNITSLMTALADGFAKRDATALIARVNSGGPPPTAAEIAALNESLFARNDPLALSACARAMVALFDVPAGRLRSATLPTLAIVGDQDLPNVEAVNRMKTVVRGLEVVVLPDANHATSVRPAVTPLIAFLGKQVSK